MPSSILQDYLNNQHISLKDDDSIDKLRKVVTEVKKLLTRKQQQIIPYGLVAIDPKVADTDPVIQEVEAMIIKKWPTFKNNVATNDKSTTYIRAVILEALSQLANSDANVTTLLWHTIRDVTAHYHLGNEQGTLTAFLQEIADKTEEYGRKQWEMNQSGDLPVFEPSSISISPVKGSEIDQAELGKGILEAAQHTGWKSYSNNIGSNPNAPNQQPWAKYFSENTAKAIGEAVNTALQSQNSSITSLVSNVQKGLDEYFSQFAPFHCELSNSIINGAKAANRRSEVIWWKQALYSLQMNNSYRQQEPYTMALVAAFDLSQLVGPLYPVSVDYLLRETLREVHQERVEEKKLLTDWMSLPVDETLKIILQDYTDESSDRKMLLSALANVVLSGSDKFFEETDIDPKAEISLADLSVWTFHNIQAYKLAMTKSRKNG